MSRSNNIGKGTMANAKKDQTGPKILSECLRVINDERIRGVWQGFEKNNACDAHWDFGHVTCQQGNTEGNIIWCFQEESAGPMTEWGQCWNLRKKIPWQTMDTYRCVRRDCSSGSQGFHNSDSSLGCRAGQWFSPEGDCGHGP